MRRRTVMSAIAEVCTVSSKGRPDRVTLRLIQQEVTVSISTVDRHSYTISIFEYYQQ